MTLHLDARRRAMLAEMGVRVWLPRAAELAAPARPAENAGEQAAAQELAAPAPAQPDSPAQKAPVAPVAAPAPAREPADRPSAAQGQFPALHGLNWAALRQAADTCQACTLYADRQHAVWDAAGGYPPDGLPRWLFVLDPPGPAENASGQPQQGDAGTLLANMAAAVRLQPAQVVRSHATRCAPTGRPAALPEIAQCAAYLRREMALVRPQVVVALGRNAAWSLLQRAEPLGQLRGQVHHVAVPPEDADLQPVLQPIPVIVSYPLDYLLRNPPAKARAWEDLCLAHMHAAAPR